MKQSGIYCSLALEDITRTGTVGAPSDGKAALACGFPHVAATARRAAAACGSARFGAGVAEEQALDTVLPFLSRERSIELASECLELYLWDRLGSDN